MNFQKDGRSYELRGEMQTSDIIYWRKYFSQPVLKNQLPKFLLFVIVLFYDTVLAAEPNCVQ